MNIIYVALIIGAAGVVIRLAAAILRHNEESTAAPAVDRAELRNRILAQLASGDRIAAVRLHRKRTRSSLREANDYVEDLARMERLGWL